MCQCCKTDCVSLVRKRVVADGWCCGPLLLTLSFVSGMSDEEIESEVTEIIAKAEADAEVVVEDVEQK